MTTNVSAGTQGTPPARPPQPADAPPPDIYEQARKYLPNLTDEQIRQLDPEFLALLVRRGELDDELKALQAKGLGGSAKAQELMRLIQALDDIIAQLRELDRKLWAAAVVAWKAAIEKGRVVRLETFLLLGIIDSLSGIPATEVKGVAFKGHSRNLQHDAEVASSSNALERLRRVARD